MKTKRFLIEIHLDKHIAKSDLDLRHILVDTIESRNLGEVVEETSSSKMIEVVIEISKNVKIKNDLKSLLTSLGFNHYNIQDISTDNEE